MSPPSAASEVSTAPAFLRACRREPVPHTPVWFMRQAGRSLPEYRASRAGVRMLDACRDPALVCEVTLQPVRRHRVDAAILFSDIMVPLAAAGIDLDITPGVGPVVAAPVRTAADVAAIRPLDASDVTFIDEAVRLLDGDAGAVDVVRPHVELGDALELHGGGSAAPAADRERVAAADQRQRGDLELDEAAPVQRAERVAPGMGAQVDDPRSVRVFDLYGKPRRADAFGGPVSDSHQQRIAGRGPAVGAPRVGELDLLDG